MSTPSSIKTLSSSFPDKSQVEDFDAIRLRIASPARILEWSHGEVVKPETINYRTQKPERDGLFCERIFGPVKDWECACGKYKKIRYKGIVCDKCGVEVTRALVRRENMGHISLCAPVSHIWFLRGVPSKIGLVLDLSASALEKVIYFASFIITKVNDDLKQRILEQAQAEYKSKKKALASDFERQKSIIYGKDIDAQKKDKEFSALVEAYDKKLNELDQAILTVKKELDDIKPLQIISEHDYHDLSIKYGHIFEAGIGAEAIHGLLSQIDLEKALVDLEAEAVRLEHRGNLGQKGRLTRRVKLFRTLIVNKIRPEWMVLTTVPVIPPDLRPMVQLDGGRFASSDLNDLYRRVINRNNRLKKLIELNAPEVIRRNEKRMLQEAVDALIDNSARHGKTVTASTGQKRELKSIADILKGKQGRFRQNLLGKRVDYSGRSVIIVGPHLKLHQVGLPKTMAIELFKPFVISELIKRGLVHNVRSASRLIEQGPKEVWDILEEVTDKATVMINRAPTLHRLSIQAFKPILIEGKAIQIHPLVCPAFNADFDGDQMAVHIPITEEAKKEASNLMLSINNLLKPATGDPVTTPDKDMIWGCYLMTLIEETPPDKVKCFCSDKEALLAYDLGKIKSASKIKVMVGGKIIETAPGRLIFNSILPQELRNYETVMDKKSMKKIVSKSLDLFGSRKTAKILDAIKDISFEYMTQAGTSWGMDDLPALPEREQIIQEAEKQVEQIEEQYEAGFLADEERHIKIIELWVVAKDKIIILSQKCLDKHGSVYSMIESGARGSWGQVTQMMGMKGLVTNPQGEIIELPIKANYKKGFNVLEYFIATHGSRKGLADTALRTANAGYLTRRLIDVSHDVVITEEDCGDKQGITLTRVESEEMGEELESRLVGRVLIEDIADSSGKIIAKKGDLVSKTQAAEIAGLKLNEVRVRTVINCKALRGICKKCYGYDLGYNKPVKTGTAVGIIAAQSIGEPGTQLTLKTFHTGGVAGKDITQGLPRVEEIFEARLLKRKAIIAEISGQVAIIEEAGARRIQIKYNAHSEEIYPIKKGYALNFSDGDTVESEDVLMEKGKIKVKAKNKGAIKITGSQVKVIVSGQAFKEYPLTSSDTLWVSAGDLVNVGDQLTEGSVDLYELYAVKGAEAVQKYIIKEIQFIYSSQGQKLNDKHIEIIARQMFSRCLIVDSGDTNLLPGEITSKVYVNKINEDIEKIGKKPAKVQELLLGITKVSLSVDSFLSAASFQETARVLIDAATNCRVDHLLGLKENVIIGRLIPAGTGFLGQSRYLPNNDYFNKEEEL